MRMSMVAHVQSVLSDGLKTIPVTVECCSNRGIPGITITGLAHGAVSESRDRVRSAIRQCGFGDILQRHYVINLIPADIPKHGSHLDLAIAVSILICGGAFDQSVANDTIFIGGLRLTGEVIWDKRFTALLFWSMRNASNICTARPSHADLFSNLHAVFKCASRVLICSDLSDVLEEKELLQPEYSDLKTDSRDSVSYRNIRGLFFQKYALRIAAAGGHHVLLYGPPGTGKTMLADALYGLLPAVSEDMRADLIMWYLLKSESYEESVLYAIAQGKPPMQKPHHSVSVAGLVGGGSKIGPGSITLAHHGLLILDELPEFSPKAIDALRQPFESGYVDVQRAKDSARLPARFQCVATMNLCSCGKYGTEEQCVCGDSARKKYQRRVSGPMRDRFDIRLPVYADKEREDPFPYVSDEQISRVRRKIAFDQFGLKDALNMLGSDARDSMDLIFEEANSMRSAYRILRVARTIALLHDRDRIFKDDIALAERMRGGLRGWE